MLQLSSLRSVNIKWIDWITNNSWLISPNFAPKSNNIDTKGNEMSMEYPINFALEKEYFLFNIFEKSLRIFRGAFNSCAYTWSDLSKDFFGINPGTTQVRLYQENLIEGREFIVSRPDNGGIIHDYDAEKIAKFMNDGATIVINGFGRQSLRAAELRDQICDFTSEVTIGNAYISKGKSKTFGLHFDRHCVFVAQMLGQKRWKVYKPTFELPLNHQLSSNFKDIAPPTEVAFDDILNEGDVLYLPRGWWHEASTVDGEPSFHITYGVHTDRVYNYMKWVLMKKMPGLIEARRSINSSASEKSEILSEAINIYINECKADDAILGYENEKRAQITINTIVRFEEIMKESASV